MYSNTLEYGDILQRYLTSSIPIVQYLTPPVKEFKNTKQRIFAYHQRKKKNALCIFGTLMNETFATWNRDANAVELFLSW